jgi:dTDP-4-amino-4,6-dideoxygalactose transaminase
MTIPITKPFFGPEELRAVQEPLESGWVVQGPFVKRFEDRFSEFTGAEHSVATSSCTTALHVAVAALGLKPGDEVIVPAFTWVATPNVVEYMGARPVFCDVDVATFNIQANQVEALITNKTVGIMPVHLFGLCADMTPILEAARRHELWVVEDAACGLGAWYEGKHAGTLGDMGCFSFHPRKSITTGEGGMITTANQQYDTLCRSLRDHGASKSDHERHTDAAGFLLSDYNLLGYNYRMTDMQGALGCAQMFRLAWILERRRTLAERYDEMLADMSWLKPPAAPKQLVHGYQSYVCLFAPDEPSTKNLERLHAHRNGIMDSMEKEGVATRQGTHAAHLQGFYRDKYDIAAADFPNAWIADRLSISLPLFAQMTEAEQGEVVSSLKRGFESAAKG